ncbi:hypothetical protein ANCCAN_03232 [Ancylostoma caninum]|uniref:SprT-like domain-containing protein n=1 Tax=Ancylostoma caninum TaxID=29170 RepID=A0A368H4P8_ANCCA|nr:hypothetical protein ANCCAN_03232 [Ancylostoma caninum]
MSYDLVDPALELSDPCPDIHVLFIDFNDRFFEGKLSRCEVKWSPRMFSCAGVCSYEGRSGMCSIRLSLPLLKLRPRKDLIETLLHEMIHAFLFVTKRNRDRDGHGPDFQFHMYRINKMANTRITIYHSFHDEVEVYKQHWWRCDGPCRDRKPFYGYVKRSSNRAPGPNDLWWNSHKASCNGTFEKIKEPEGYGQKKRKANGETIIPEKKPSPKNTLDRYFSTVGGGQTLGTASQTVGTPKSSRLLDEFGSNGAKKNSSTSGASVEVGKKKVVLPVQNKSIPRTATVEVIGVEISAGPSRTLSAYDSTSKANGSADCPIELDDDSNQPTTSAATTLGGGEVDEVDLNKCVYCPSCGDRVIEFYINEHLDLCIYLQ